MDKLVVNHVQLEGMLQILVIKMIIVKVHVQQVSNVLLAL